MPQIPLRTLLLLIAVVLGLWFVMSWRTEAQVLLPVDPGPEERPGLAVGLLEDALRETFEIDGRVTLLEDNDEAGGYLERMASVDQAFLLRVDGETQVVTPRDIFESGGFGNTWTEDDWTLNARYFLSQYTNSSEIRFLEVEIEDETSVVALRDAALIGLLPHLSRVVEPSSTDTLSALPVDGCSDWLELTLNIFRQPAEVLRSCMQARCEGSEMSQCRVAAINGNHGWTTQMDFDPGAPIEGISVGESCTALFGYEIKQFVGNIPVPIMEFAVGRSISGVVSSRLACDGSVVLERR